MKRRKRDGHFYAERSILDPPWAHVNCALPKPPKGQPDYPNFGEALVANAISFEIAQHIANLLNAHAGKTEQKP